MNCREFRTIVDSYLSDELLVETNHDVLLHLEDCTQCRSEVTAKRALRLRIGNAVKNSREFQVDPLFASRLTADLQSSALRLSFLERLTSIRIYRKATLLAAGIAGILIVTLGLLLWMDQRSAKNIDARRSNVDPHIILPQSQKSDDKMDQAILASWNEIFHEAIGDHKNCALEFRLVERPVSLDEAAKKYGRYNRNIEKVVISALQNNQQDDVIARAELLEAHSCLFAGRRFTHIVLRVNREIVSVMVTDSNLPAGEIQSGAEDGNLHAAGANIGQFAVFVVSELPDSENATIAAAVSPAIRRHIEQSGI